MIPIDYGIAAHAPVLADVAEEYRRLHWRPTADVPGVRFYSGATGESYRASADRAADALAAQIVGTIDFVRVIERAWADGVRVFVEHGPQAQCTGWIRRILGERAHLSVALDAPGGRGTRQLGQVVAELVAAGAEVDAAAFFDRLATAVPAAAARTETIRLPAHPPEMRLPGREPPVAVMPRAPRLVPVADSFIQDTCLPGATDGYAAAGSRSPGPDGAAGTLPAAPPGTPDASAAAAPDSITAAGPGRIPAGPGRRPARAPAGVAGVVAQQFQNVTALHRDFLARQAQAHAEFLRARQQGAAALIAMMRGSGAPPLVPLTEPHQPPVADGPATPVPASAPPGGAASGGVPGAGPLESRVVPCGPTFDRAQLEWLAEGRVSELFGPQFAVLDDRPKQTRLPKPPMLLADRVTGIDAIPGSMGTGTVWTETDVAPDGWYLDAAGRMAAGLMIEAGQADLLLISWLGVDLLGQGDRVYRLLGCEVTFHGSPALAGQTLRYEIQIYRHAEHDGVRIFFFHYDCYAGDELRMTVREGQAGFFTDDAARQHATACPGRPRRWRRRTGRWPRRPSRASRRSFGADAGARLRRGTPGRLLRRGVGRRPRARPDAAHRRGPDAAVRHGHRRRSGGRAAAAAATCGPRPP